MKILICSDFHLHTYKSFGMDSRLNIPRRLSDQRNVLRQILGIVAKDSVEMVCFVGDLFHQMGEIPTEALNVADWFFNGLKDLGIPWTVVRGNHDVTRRVDAGKLHSAVEPFVGCLPPHSLKICRYDFDSTTEDSSIVGHDLVLVHKDIKDIDYGGYNSRDIQGGVNWKLLAENNRYVFFGHIHRPMKLAKNAFIIGAPMHLNFGDTGDRGVWLLDLESNDVRFMDLEFPKFITVTDPALIEKDNNYYRLLGAEKAIDQDNVVTVIEPQKYEARMHETGFDEILLEWIKMNGKDPKILECIATTLQTRVARVNALFPGRLSHVSVENFFSFASAQYSISNGLTLVNGQSDCFSSNGSGKTSLISEAILWCLFGVTSKGLKGDDVIRRGQDDCKVTVVLEANGVMYHITRSRSSGLQIDLDRSGADIEETTSGMLQKQAQEYLEKEILGFDVTLFKTACLFSQENLLMMTSLSDTEKTSMISGLLGFDDYEHLGELVSITIRDSEGILDTLTASIENLKASLIYQVKYVGDKRDEVRKTDERRKQLHERRASLLLEVSDMTQKSINVGDDAPPVCGTWEDTIKTKSSELLQAKAALEEVDGALSKMHEVKSGVKEKLAEARMLVAKFEIEATSLKNSVHNLESLVPGETCDKCGATISVDVYGKLITEKLDAHVQVKAKALDATLIFDSINAGLTLIEEEINTATQEKNDLKSHILTTEFDIDEARTALSEYQTALRAYERKQATRKNELDVRKATISGLNEQLADLDKAETQILFEIDNYVKGVQETETSVNAKLSEIALHRAIMEDLLFWKTAFSPSGIRSVLLDRFCNDFNKFVNVYLSSASGGKMSIVMTPTKQLKSGEERNKIGMDIFNDGHQMKYESLSGGEKRRVDFALCLGLTTFVSDRFNLPAGLLGLVIFDELFSFLDRSAEEAIGQVLREEGRKKAVFIISHTPELESYADRTMTVIKEKGISRL